MKKSLFLLAALAISAMSFADNTSTWNIANATAAGVNKGSYGDLKDVEATITLDGVIYLAQDIMRNNKNASLNVAADQILMFKKNAGHFINKTAVDLVSLVLVVNNETYFEVSSGLAADALSAETLTGADESVSLNDAEGNPSTQTLRKVTVNLSGKKFVKVAALNEGTPFVYSAVLTYSGSGGEATHVASVSLDVTEKTLVAYETLQLTATVLPAEADDKSVTWASSDEKVATVSETGLVSAWAEGKATITVKSVDGEKTATCALTVTAPQKSVFGRIKPSELKDKDTVIITMTVDSIGIPMVLCADEVKSAPGPKAVAGGIIEGTIVPATDNMVFVADVSEAGIRFRPVLKEIEDSVYLYVYGGESTNDGVRVAKVGKTDTYGNTWVIDAETGYLKATYTYIKNKGKETETQEEYTRYLGEVDGVFKAYKLDAKGNLSSKIKGQTLKLFVKGAEPPVEYYFNTAWNGGAAQWVLGMDAGEFTNPNAQLPGAWVVDGKWGGADVLVNTKPAEEGALKFLRVDGEGKAQILYMDVRENCTDCSAEPEVGTEVEIVYCTPEFTMNPNLTGRLVVMYMSVDQHSIENVIINGTSAEKVFIDGQLYIIRDGVMYNVQGARVR